MTASTTYEQVDVLIIGAGLSGIGAACQLARLSPNQKVAICEARSAIGGTWDLFKYPGIRSDSDMYTYGYGFKPWVEKEAIADGSQILEYIRDAAKEYDVERLVRYNHKVVTANWVSDENRWHVQIVQTDTGEQVTVRCRFMFNCCGYYDYDNGYTPQFAGIDQFGGQVVHAQHWPEDLDYSGKRVVVIGSGATAVTLVPTMSQATKSLTMLQRSPSYVVSVPKRQLFAKILSPFMPKLWVSKLSRWKQVLLQIYIYQMSRIRPNGLKDFLIKQIRKELGDQYDIDKHFTPNYNPWDQRLCAVPDNDLFDAIKEGRAEVVTDHIDQFNSEGILLKSGTQLNADIVVLATGLTLKLAGGIEHSIDGRVSALPDHFVYRGMMFSDFPNMAFTVGYTNSSWTPKADLTAKFVARLLDKLDQENYASVTPRLHGNIGEVPLLDFDAGYVLRAREQFPKQGDRLPWKNYQNYIKDYLGLNFNKLDDAELEFRK